MVLTKILKRTTKKDLLPLYANSSLVLAEPQTCLSVTKPTIKLSVDCCSNWCQGKIDDPKFAQICISVPTVTNWENAGIAWIYFLAKINFRTGSHILQLYHRPHYPHKTNAVQWPSLGGTGSG